MQPQAQTPPERERRRRARRPSPRREAEDGYEEEDLDGPFVNGSPPRERRMRSGTAVPMAPPMSAPPSYASSAPSSPPRPRKPKSPTSADKPAKERKGGDKCRVAGLCRSLAGVGFGQEEGCLGGF